MNLHDQAAADARARARSARPLRRQSSARNTPSPIRRRRSPIWSRCATSITATRRWCCGRARSPKSRRSSSSPTRPRPRSCRRAATPAWSAGKFRITARSCCRSTRLDKIREVDPVSNTITCEAGVTLQRAREAAADGRPALSATAAVGRHLHHRRQSFDQCRRHRGARPRHRALACARPRSGAGRRPRAEQPQQAEEGQHRLRPEEPVHRRRRHARHHHRGGAAAGAAAALGRDRLRRRALAAGRGRSARPRHRAHRRRRHQLRDDGARRRRSRGQARRRRAAIRWPARIPGTC